MSDNIYNPKLSEMMLSEHKELANVLAEIREAISAPERTKNQVDDLMTRLCELVETHFSNEEQGGYLKDALQQAPHYREQARTLLEQHEALLEDVKKLRVLAHSGVESSAWWIHIESNFHKFASALDKHEHAEIKVVQQAYTEDIGTKD